MTKKNKKEARWRLADLQNVASQALAEADDYEGADSGRVSAIPNERTLRYYTTIGLLDRPAEMRGRTAFYGWRHVLQVVAIKRLQEEGLTLVDIQQRLVGRGTDALAAIAKLPETAPKEYTATQTQKAKETTRSRKDRPFWMHAESSDLTAIAEVAPSASKHLSTVHLHPALLLTWTGCDADPDDLTALRSAAEPLIREMQKRGLLEDSKTKRTERD